MRVIISPAHITLLPGEIAARGDGFTVTVAEAVSLHEPMETITLKVEEEVKVEEIEAVGDEFTETKMLVVSEHPLAETITE